MRLKIAHNDPQSMSQDGEAILRSLQNKSLPLVDLMVRESLQNSLDATLPEEKNTKVDFVVGTFRSEELAPHFETITDILLSKYPGECSYISVSDRNTSGLTGNYRTDDPKILDQSNFQKLVFGIGKNQDRDGAGGSWGLGKTSYFRMGIGVVVYYTRIHNGESYEERLIASLIENPKQNGRLLPQSERGIAWWGEFEENNTAKKIFPVTDLTVIKEFLHIFDLEPYKNDETGTTVLIPYVKSIDIEEKDDKIKTFPWEFDYVSSIKMAVQRWYAPRIWNEKYAKITGNSILDCSVNQEGLNPLFNMEPAFKLFQDLYSSALEGIPVSKNIQVKPIRLPRNAMENKQNPVGYIAFCQVSREEMKMTSPDNKPSALSFLGMKDNLKIERNKSKVVAYARKPGMVVEYSIDEDWAPHDMIQSDDHLLFGFFVPNSKGTLLKKFQDMGYNDLEQYLRATENADHASWTDENGIGIIRRMKQYSAQAIRETFQSLPNDARSSAVSALSRKFGAMLMPPKNFGQTSTRKKDGERDKRNVSSRNRFSDISILSSTPIDETNVKVAFKAFIKKPSLSTISIQVHTQEDNVDVRSWEKTMGTAIIFPFEIEKVFLKSLDGEEINVLATDYQDSEIDFHLQVDKPEQFQIASKVPGGIEIEGTIYLRIISNQYLPTVIIRTENLVGGDSNDGSNS